MGHAQRARQEQFAKTINNYQSEVNQLREVASREQAIRSLIKQIPSFQRDRGNNIDNSCGKFDCRTGLYWQFLGSNRGIEIIALVPNERPRNQRSGGHARIPIKNLTSALEQAILRTEQVKPRIIELDGLIKCIINPTTRDNDRKNYGLLSLKVTDKYFKGQFPSWSHLESLWNSSNAVIITARKDLEKYGLPPMECNQTVPKESPMDIAYSHNLLMEVLGKPKTFLTKAQWQIQADSIRHLINTNNNIRIQWNAIKDKGIDGGTLLIDLSKPKAERKEELRKIKEEKDRIAEEKRQKEIARLAEIERLRVIEVERISQEKLKKERLERERIESERIERERVEEENRIKAQRVLNEQIKAQKVESERNEFIEAQRLEQLIIDKNKLASTGVLVGGLGLLLYFGLKK